MKHTLVLGILTLFGNLAVADYQGFRAPISPVTDPYYAGEYSCYSKWMLFDTSNLPESAEATLNIDGDYQGGTYPANLLILVEAGTHIITLKAGDQVHSYTLSVTEQPASDRRSTYCQLTIP